MTTVTSSDDWVFSAKINGQHINTPSTYSCGLGYGSAGNPNGEERSTGVGFAVLAASLSGNDNTGVGYGTLNSATTAHSNTAVGSGALLNNEAGTDVTAVGKQALYNNTGSRSTAVGSYALTANTTATQASNEALGYAACYANTTGYYNIGIGAYSLYTHTDNHSNIAIGFEALYSLSSENSNIGIGTKVLRACTGGKNIAIGYQCADNITSADNSITIGHDLNAISATADNQLNIGGVIFGDLSSGNIGIADSSPSYKLEVAGTFYSSGSSIEYKEDVTEYTPPEGGFMSLRPVQYNYRKAWKDFGKKYAGNSSKQLGLVAEDVAKVLPELAITKTENGKEVVRNVDYEKLTVLLVAEVQDLRKELDILKTK